VSVFMGTLRGFQDGVAFTHLAFSSIELPRITHSLIVVVGVGGVHPSSTNSFLFLLFYSFII
jgi:hypothetical protein